MPAFTLLAVKYILLSDNFSKVMSGSKSTCSREDFRLVHLVLLVAICAPVVNAGTWGPWRGWSSCSATCGNGVRERSRVCEINMMGASCSSEILDGTDIELCKVEDCPLQECGGTLTDNAGSIQSPNYPDNYPAGANCTWKLVAPSGYYFELEVITFFLESSPNCGRDYVRIEGIYTNGYAYCGRAMSGMIKSTSNEVSIHFVSDYQTGDKGFDFKYTRKVIPKCDGGDNFCYNGGTCSGINECDCKLGFIGYRCSYSEYDTTTNDAEPSGEFHFPSKVCSMYGADHVETFENHKYQLSRACQYMMAKFGNTEEILVRRDIDCPSTRSCLKKVEITSGTSNVVKITRDGVVNFDGENITLPVSKYGFGISQTKWHIFIMFNDWKLTIDKKGFSLFLTATPESASQAKGLCSIARDKTNGLASVSSIGLFLFTHEWEQNDVGESCTSDDATTSPCPDDQTDQESVCNVLYTEAFDECRLNISVNSYYKQCLSDLCQCSIEQTDDCHCSVVSKYARDCARAGFAIGKWRTATSCKRTCPGNKVFLECAKSCPATCENTGFGHCNEECTDGCQCVEGKYWDGSWCVSKDECPCSHAGRKYKPGETVIEGCKHRVCLGSIWNYTEVDCPATASAVGFSHFKTFDGSWFDFPASKCEYLFVEDKSEAKSFSIYVTAEPCGSHSRFSCIRKVKLIESMSSHSYYVTLLQNGGVLSQNNILAALPTTNGGITVRRITSIYIEAVIADLGVSVLWNGRASLHVTVPKSFTEKLHGLCGNYNSRTVDDLTDKSGVVSAPVVFGNSWKQPAECPDVDSTNSLNQACLINQHLAESAKEQCDIMKGPLFATCRNYVPYDTYYTNCKEDVCACEAGSDCLCDAVAVYAYECIKVGVEVNWRSNDFCHVPCSGDQSFQTNGTLCSRTCRSRTENDVGCFKEHGVEGCSCPKDTYLSEDGSCVQLRNCPCYVNQEWIAAAHVSHPGGDIACTCSDGVNKCNPALNSTIKEEESCPAGMVKRDCTVVANNHQCTPTCTNLNQTCPQTTCTAECICENGLVRHNDQCIEASECPCVRDGKEFTVGDDLVDGCTILTCQENSHWQINETNCYDECKVAAGTFYTTFDDKHYQFNGFCEYILATDDCGTQLSSTTSGNFMYRITVKSQDCPGSNRAMCETTVHIIIGALEITLRTGQKPVFSNIESRQFGDLELVTISSNTHGNYFIVKSSNGLQIDWDQKTTVYVRMDRSLREKYPPCGMCGNNDGDSSNDFKTMNNDITTSPAQFGNSWKLLSHCADALEVSETCHRGRTWAEQQCEVINTAFKHCHAKVDPRYYYNKCVEATCTCDVVGDCECFCSSVADYAYACGQHNIEVDWRTPSLCPIMCPNNNTDDACLWRYKACSTCYETCCNPVLCIDGCYEGCYPNCKSGTVFDELANACVVKQSCSTQDCVLPIEHEPPECQTNEELVCDWSPWKNTNKPSSASIGEFELFKNLKKLEGMCSSPKEIECRSVNSTTAERQTVTCDTQHGLVCYNEQNPSMCDDYEVRFNCCQCVTTCNETCSPPPACESHEELENITSQDDCCPNYVCKCIGCYHDGQLKSPGDEWIENCETMRCSDNGRGCYNITTANRVECSSVDCPYFAKNVPTPGSLYGKSVEECCSTNCTCRDEYQLGSGARLNCPYPEVLNVTRVTHELLSCEISTCTCPHSEMETTHCVNETSCSPAGCHAQSTYSCGCAISSTCVCNPADCPEVPKNCSRCYELVSRPAGVASFPDTRCETSTCCSVDTCEPIQCNNTEAVECGANEIRTKIESNSSCCDEFVCKCIYCVDELGNKREVGDKWYSHNDSSCVTMGCIKSNGSYCPVMKVIEDKRLACPVIDITCSKYETKVEEKNGACCTQTKCYCNESACPTGATECPNGMLIVDEEKSDDRCCDVKKCCLDTCIDEGTHKSGDVWMKDTCHAKRCDCTCDSCNVTELPLYNCSQQAASSCVSDLSPILRENSIVPCCPISECPCQCEVFGDPHYFTFDHTHYKFAGECQYTLVTYRDSDRLHIYSDNQNCSSEGGIYSVCLKRIYVKWEDTLVALYYEPGMTPEEAVTVNGRSIPTLPWYVTGMQILLSSGKLQLSITEIKLSLEFALEKVPSTKITVPMSTMFNETVGLCGTCSNNKEDDFESRDNTLTLSVDEFAASWLVNETKENCVCTAPECKTCSDPNYQSPTCNCSSECEVLRSKLFETCNALIDPTNWLNACEADARGLDECNICKSSAVESYASSCLKRGICVDWRSAAGCLAQQCSEGFEYKACAPSCEVEQTCENYRDGETCESDLLVSGCFCEDGLIRKTAGSSECVRPECCASCPSDPICPPDMFLSEEIGNGTSCCPKRVCECPNPKPLICLAPEVLTYTNHTCPQPICMCELCNHSLPNCTEHLGCHIKVLQQDACGCPVVSECQCNPDLCPEKRDCGNCSVAVAVERNTSSETDECENCCTSWECRPVTCSPDYNKDPIPEGYKKMQDNDECCPTIYCASCHLADGSYQEVGSTWFETVEGCSIEYMCSNQTKVDECYNETVINDPRRHCKTREHYQSECKHNATLHEVHSNDPCCKNYTCVCSPSEKKKCLHPGEIVIDVQSSEEYCNPEQQCNCSTDMNLLRNECKQFKETTANCTQEDRHVEQAKEAGHDIDDPCCPAYECTCNKCPDDRPTCSEGYKLEDQRSDGDCCSNWTCVCDVCFDRDNLPIARGSSVKVTDNIGCTSTFICSSTKISNNGSCYKLEEIRKPPCETKTTFEERECNTPLQYAVPVTYKDGQIDPNFCCEEYQCVCNSSVNKEELEVCEERANCSSDGCNPHETELCGCFTSSHCVCDSHHCRSAPTCEKCHILMTKPAANVGTSDERCASNTCCPSYSCAPVPCNNTEPVICGDKEVKTKVPDGECCTKEVCICELCVDEQNNTHEIGDNWPDYSDPSCVTKVCTRDKNKQDKCPVIGILKNKRETCLRVNEATCGAHERKVQYAVDECCFESNCSCDPSLYPITPETCEADYELVVDNEASDHCVNVTKCCPTTCIDKGYRYQDGQEWTDGCERKRCNCDCASCEIVPIPRCPKPVVPTCANGLRLVQVPNAEEPCCPNYQCRCECIVFGDPHYVTFDNNFYTFMGKCSYTLVTYRESSRLHIYSENTVCNPDIEATCLKRVFVKWDDTLVEISDSESMAIEQSVTVNGVRLQQLPWSQSGIRMMMANRRIVLTIPEIELELRYSNFYLPSTTISIPMSTMFNKTVGLCGTCSNDQDDDFEGGNKTLISSVREFGASWRTSRTVEECECNPLTDPVCADCSDPRTPAEFCKNCSNGNDCNLLESDTFKECNPFVDPESWIRACEQDARTLGNCNGCDSNSIRVYAEICAENGVCIDWRSALNCTRESTCPDGFEDKTCVRACDVEQTCDNYMHTTTCTDDRLISGCFCKPGFVKRTTDSNECVEKSCCSCPEDPTCLPNQILHDVPSDEESCCPNKTCVCEHEVNPDYCKPPFVLKYSNNSCPNCICPEKCSSDLPNCTHMHGCHLNVTEQDACGCPESGKCECNPVLCPEKSECGNCSVAVAVERNTSSKMDECENCCIRWQCRPVTCSPDYNKDPVPEGCKKSYDDDECCPTLDCRSCLLNNGSYKWQGETWYETENGCRVKKICSNEKDLSDSDSGYKPILLDDGTSHCLTKDEFEELNCDKSTEVAVESESNGLCCTNYTCTCNPNPPFVLCSYFAQEPVKVYPKDKNCPIEECVCKNNSEKLCPNYWSVYGECQAYPNKEVVKTNETTFLGPCCPRFRCDCKNCSELVYNTTCSRGFTQDTKFDGCCNRTVCKCNSCMNEKGEHFEVGVTWWEVDKTGCNTSYSCEKTNSITNEGCYIPTASPRICNVPECPQNTTRTEIQYNVSHADPDLCCPEYNCPCNPCPSGYKSPPTNVPDHYHVEKNMSNPCCPTWSLICDVCQRSDGSTMNRGSSTNETYEDGCPVTYTCTDQRIGNNATACFVIDEFSDRQTCLHKDDFESSCNTTYQHAVEVVYSNGESDPNPCCTEYTCSCKNSDTLATICPTTKFNYEICNQSGRKNLSFTPVPSTCGCCTEPSCPCFNELELVDHCPPKPICEYGKEPIKYTIEGECCPKYNCTCSVCPTDYQPYPNATLAPYEKYELIESPGWKCCPTRKIVCNDTSQCPVPTCAANYTLVILPDQYEPDTNGCCPKCVCRCDVCVLQDGSLKQVGESWIEQVDGGCSLTLSCTKHRVSSSALALQSCHETVLTFDPRDWCQTKTQFESKFCNNYTEAVLSTDDKDSDLCCDDYICTCKSDDQLKTVCPNDMNESCSVYMEKTEVGTISGTNDCCPEYACTCQSDEVLSSECQQWDDYECPLGNKRYMIRERNNATGPCCPEFGCTCLPDEMLAQVCEHWNFSCSYGQKRVKTNDGCCPTYECVCDKCVYDQGIYPVNTTFSIEADHCLQGVCILNVTSNCPEAVIQEKYKCPFVNETDCLLRGGKLLANETVQGCCKYCCSCPEDPTCPPNQILHDVPGDEESCCPNKTCACHHKVDPDYCKPPFVLKYSNNSCPNCTCPEKCSSDLLNCTQELGCRLNVTEQDACGCPESGKCECNPVLCPEKSECGNCSVAVAVERNTSSKMDECENCCIRWQCRPVTCSPDYNKDPVPEGCKKSYDDDECCPTLDCRSCLLNNGSYKWQGETWYEIENSCRVKKICSNEKDSPDSDSGYKPILLDDGTSHCLTKDEFEELNCDKSTEVAVESESNGSCCPNYTCICNPNPPFVLCSYFAQEPVKVYPKDKNCPIEECVCKNNSEELCPNYWSVYGECQAYPNKEVVKTNETTFLGPCCPRFRCDCKNCSELVDNTTCSKGFTQDTKFDGCCNRTACKCNSCMNEKEEHFEVGVTWWEVDKTGCNTSYSCEKTNSITNEGCYIPTASPRICNVPECPQYTTRTEIQYNVSHADPDLCCPEYDCPCNPCPISYKPPPTNVPDHYHVEINMTNPCCPTWSLICDVCQRSDGSTMNRGSSTNETYEDGCPVTYTCTDQRIGNIATACFVIDEFSKRQTCLHKDAFESSCNTTYQHAVEVVYSNGESDPNPCCTEYTCSCKNSDTLATICPTTKFNYEICNQPGRKNLTFTPVPSTCGCCTEPSCPCFNELELVDHCPPIPICEYGKEPIKYTIEGECCPQYNCTCSVCPTDYPPYSNANLAPYEKYELIKSPGWKCCPTYKIVCNDTSQCPVPTCAANHTMVKLPDQYEPDTNGCCPKCVCRCDVCVLQDGSLKQVGESWNEQVDGGCSLTLNCTKHRVNSSSSALDSCHEAIVTSDPRDWCRTKSQFESKFCNNYTEAVLSTYDKDSDPCCDDYICTCKSDDQLKTVCPNDMNESCSVYMEKTEVGTISGTNDCCPEYACTCQSDEVLSSECQQWDDYECPLGNKRYMIRERNNATGPCCPEFGCTCLPDEMLAQVCEHWNFSCSYGQKRVKTNDGCCPTYECVCDKCVYDQGIYPVNTTFSIEADHCLQGVCVPNVTSNCPETVVQEKYKCPFVNETDCLLRGGRLVANETVQGCCKYCEPTPAPCKRETDRLILNATIDTHICWTKSKVDVNFCTGSCPTIHGINAETGKMEGLCQCCKSLRYGNQKHDMICDDGLSRQYTHKVIFDCGCQETSCEAKNETPSFSFIP